MMKKSARQALWLLLWLYGAAHAHLMPDNQATFNLKADAAYMVLSLPVQIFQGVELNADGLTDAAALQRHSGRIEAQLRRHLQLQLAQTLVPFELSLLTPSLAEHGPLTDQALLFVRFAWPQGPPRRQDLELKFNLFPAGSQASLRVEVMAEDSKHPITLTPAWPQAALWPSAWAQWQRYTLQGMAHMALGADHLLFLALLLLRQLRLQRWVMLLSAFTVAHALSYGLVLMGPVAMPQAWIETGIAATLCVSALMLFWRRSVPVWLEAPMVVGFGLVHGLGFASAMMDLERSSPHAWLALLSFNLGIEVAQLLLALTLWLLLTRPGVRQSLPRMQAAGAWAGLTLSLSWLVQRWGS